MNGQNMNVHLGTTKYISNISLAILGEEKYFNIFSKAIYGGCLPDAYWDVVPYFNTISQSPYCDMFFFDKKMSLFDDC